MASPANADAAPVVRGLQLGPPVVQQRAWGPRVEDFASVLETGVEEVQVLRCSETTEQRA